MAPAPVSGLPAGRISVDEDLPAWCRMTSNELVSFTKVGKQRSFLAAKGRLEDRQAGVARAAAPAMAGVTLVAVKPMTDWSAPAPAPRIAPLAVTSIGSWPRPRWMVQAVHEHMEGRLDEAAFQATADDALRLAVAAQLRAGVDLLTDGEQRRDSCASVVASRLDNCQLIPLTDLLPLVDDPEEFERELRALDVPAGDVPYLFGTLDARHGASGIDALDRSCSDAFAQAWVAFARQGDPGPLANPGLSA